MDDRLDRVTQALASPRLMRELSNVLDRLASDDVSRLNEILSSITEIQYWDSLRKQAIAELGKRRLFGVTSGVPGEPPYSITFCWCDLSSHSDTFVRGTIAHEFGHAVTLADNEAGNNPCGSADMKANSWGFTAEIQEQYGCRDECLHK